MFFTVSFFMGFNACLLAGLLLSRRIRLSRLIEMPFMGMVSGGLLFAHAICHGWAISLTKAVYMIAVKRISILIGIIYGEVFFNEQQMIYRLLGAGLMISGAALVTLKGH